ncbi:SDR family NAD(P)-dependent oxidoreductase [Salinicola avicenniae]|uniref:SDR family NAD(P)-dependent oxidoreductase n=1 Tax=Salinicola avicenniae TaxID=2916836 RepID=UPI00207355DA|nr:MULTISPECIES: SDR family NAD(P)-dependent oxidoreductase [unclassified Salinicola]
MSESQKIALVTGANRGLGRAIADSLVGQGVQVLAGCRNPESLRDDERQGFMPVALDVTDPATVDRLRDEIAERFGRLDILVNNAGLFLDFETSLSLEARYRRMFDVNVFGATLMTETMTPLLARAGSANVVNISSGLGAFGLRTDPEWDYAEMNVPFYAASKAALNALTLSHSRALAPLGIRVNAVCPGLTATEATQFQGREAWESAPIAVAMALQSADGQTGKFLNDAGELPW